MANPIVDFDAVELAKCTHQAILVLYPWCMLAGSESAVLPGVAMVAQQAERYMEAVEMSMQAAEYGFTVAQEALDMCDLLPGVSDEEKAEYLKGMLYLAKQGKLKAMETMGTFMDIENRVSSLMEHLPAEINMPGIGLMNKCSTIHAWIKPLSELKLAVSKFEAWWRSIFFQNIKNEHRTELLVQMYNRMREESVVRSWQRLQRQHADYVMEMDTCISQHPEFLKLLDKIKKQRRTREASGDVFEDPHNQDYIQIVNGSLYYGVSVSAIVESVEARKDSTQFVVEFQCDSSDKVKQLRIVFNFACTRGTTSPRVLNIAPRECIGYVTKERQYVQQKLEVPIGWSFLGFNIGATPGVEKKVTKTVHRGMSIVGYNDQKKCSWTIKENGSTGSGIPPHFQVRFDLLHQGPFELSLTLEAKIKTYKYLPSYRGTIKDGKEIDISRLQRVLANSYARRRVDDNFNGEVPNAYQSFGTPPILT